MNCTEARHFLGSGLRPGTATPRQIQLGFHLATCATCRAFADAHPPADDLLATLLARTPPLPKPASVVQPAVPAYRWLRPALLLLLFIALGTWATNLLVAQRNATAPPPPGASNNEQAVAPDAADVAVVAPGLTSTATVPPTATATHTATPTPTPTATPVPTATPLPPLQPLTILLLGLDRRPDERDISRSDAMLILHIDPRPLTPTIALLSLPRDLWVPVADYGFYSKINGAYSVGESNGGPAAGAAAAQSTVAELIGQPIDYTVVTTFVGLMQIIDQIGGVEIDVPKSIYDPSYPTFDYGYMIAQFEPGLQTMDGFTALVYSRTRHADNDFERGRRQQQVLLALFTKLRNQLASGTSISNAALVAQLHDDLEYTDLDAATVLRLASVVQAADPATVRRDAVDLRYGYETSTIDGAYIIQPDVTAIQQLVATLFGTP